MVVRLPDMEWKVIPGTAYQASDTGRIRRIGGGVLKPIKAGDGYRKVKIHGRQLYVHRLVARAWISEIPKGFEINHLNSNRTDNRPVNLEICTHSQNMAHAKQPVWYATQTRIPMFA